MSRRIIIPILFFSLLTQIVLVEDLTANTAEERLIEVEKQLQAVANQIKQYEGYHQSGKKNPDFREIKYLLSFSARAEPNYTALANHT